MNGASHLLKLHLSQVSTNRVLQDPTQNNKLNVAEQLNDLKMAGAVEFSDCFPSKKHFPRSWYTINCFHPNGTSSLVSILTYGLFSPVTDM